MDRMKILYCSYRNWAKDILMYTEFFISDTYTDLDVELIHVQSTEELLSIDLSKFDMLFFIGWSEIVPDYIINEKICICLHPSPLPKYRGGSPIQNQIINGDYDSAITFFAMDSGLDTGDIIYQVPLDLSGELSEIFSKIVNLSYPVIAKIIFDFNTNKDIPRTPQNHELATLCKRRTKMMSEIQIQDFSNHTATQLYDKIRSLQDPYPNAFVRCKDDTILFLIGARI
jgi:methionyl-tRNA formyltransferase